VSIETTYSQARAELASLMSRVTDNREIVVVKRRDHPAVAMIAADELASLMETAHLLRSPANAERLLAALGRARKGAVKPKTVSALRREAGLDG
jgi:antitoxin YefM